MPRTPDVDFTSSTSCTTTSVSRYTASPSKLDRAAFDAQLNAALPPRVKGRSVDAKTRYLEIRKHISIFTSVVMPGILALWAIGQFAQNLIRHVAVQIGVDIESLPVMQAGLGF